MPEALPEVVPQEREWSSEPQLAFHASILEEMESWASVTALSITKYIDPGAGLQQLNDVLQDSDFIFDSLFMGIPDIAEGAILNNPPIPRVRTYQSNRDLLEAYYIWIHNYFPILPPPDRDSSTYLDNSCPFLQDQLKAGDHYEPTTPLTLAIAAILALIPCAEDVEYSNDVHVIFRRQYAQLLAQSAIESIEMEAEMPESTLDPQNALSKDDEFQPREAFHPLVPRELESIIALDLLSVYEYAQRGNLKKMRNRAGQALVSAMSLSLHKHRDDEDVFAEARRRVWWMTVSFFTFICAGDRTDFKSSGYARVKGQSSATRLVALPQTPS